MDVVSEGELRRALAAGVPPSRIVFSGVGKTRDEMAFALDAGIYGFNVESEAEARALSQVAKSHGKPARIAFRINPDVDARTHAKISTGKAEDKFGVPWNDAQALYALAAELPGLEPCGVHMHIGSQITDLEPFERAFKLLGDLVTLWGSCGRPVTGSISSISAAASACPIAARTTFRRTPTIMRKSSSEPLGRSVAGCCLSLGG